MQIPELAYLSAVACAEMIRQRKISACEVVRAALARAHRVQAATNCFITLCDEHAEIFRCRIISAQATADR